MDWKQQIQQRYARLGSEAFRPAGEAFGQVLGQFLSESGISIIDDNPEGKNWMMLLNDDTELYVERRSYDTGNLQTDFWIDYLPERGGVVAEFFHASNPSNQYRVLVPNTWIAAVTDELYGK